MCVIYRIFFAVCRIQAIIRGFLDRILCKEIVRERKAAIKIQKIIRGKLGRSKAKRAYYFSISVVKSDGALAEILERSSVVREKGNWIEYYDTLTDSFWYYNVSYLNSFVGYSQFQILIRNCVP